MSAALEIGAAAPTPAASSTTALQIGPPRRAAAQSCAIMWRALPAAASWSLPDYGEHTHRRQTTRTIVGPAPSAPTRLYFLVYLPLFALTQRSVESLLPSDPPPTQPPSDRRQFCRRLGGLPPPAPLPSAPRCRSSATSKDRSSSSTSLTFVLARANLFLVVALCWLLKALAALQNGCEVQNRPFPSHPSRLQWATKQQLRVRSVTLEAFCSLFCSTHWISERPLMCSPCKCSDTPVFVCEPVSLCVLTKLRVLLPAAPCAVVRAPLTLIHTVLHGHVWHRMVEPASCVARLGIREMRREVKHERTHVQRNNMICLSVCPSILRRDDP